VDTLGEVRKAIWAGLSVIVVAAVVVGALRLFRADGTAAHGTAAQIADWLEHAQGGCEVNVESVRLPMPGYFQATERRFTDAAREVKFINCEHLGGTIFYYRFASTHARAAAVTADPELQEQHRLFCVKATEVLINGLLVEPNPITKYCRRLHFRVERAHARR
jgi:hypothetical protein